MKTNPTPELLEDGDSVHVSRNYYKKRLANKQVTIITINKTAPSEEFPSGRIAFVGDGRYKLDPSIIGALDTSWLFLRKKAQKNIIVLEEEIEEEEEITYGCPSCLAARESKELLAEE